MPIFKRFSFFTSSGFDALYSLEHTDLQFVFSRKFILYGLGRIRSPNTTWPRFSTGDCVSSERQKSKWWYSKGMTDSSVFSLFTYRGISFCKLNYDNGEGLYDNVGNALENYHLHFDVIIN